MTKGLVHVVFTTGEKVKPIIKSGVRLIKLLTILEKHKMEVEPEASSPLIHPLDLRILGP